MTNNDDLLKSVTKEFANFSLPDPVKEILQNPDPVIDYHCDEAEEFHEWFKEQQVTIGKNPTPAELYTLYAYLGKNYGIWIQSVDPVCKRFKETAGGPICIHQVFRQAVVKLMKVEALCNPELVKETVIREKQRQIFVNGELMDADALQG